MTASAVDNIGTLVTNDARVGSGPLGVIRDAAVVVENGLVRWVGPRHRLPASDSRYDLQGRAALPGFVDSHAHLVFCGDRADEFAARMRGDAYRTGGILTTIAATRSATDTELTATTRRLVAEALRSGTTTVEIKSGYGQTVADELRGLRVAAAFTTERTLLAAHVPPPEFAGRADEYVTMVCERMIPVCAPHARWIDVFCEQGAFDADQCRAVLQTGIGAGLGARVHGNQLGPGPGVRLAVDVGAASVDHVTHVDAGDVDALAGGPTAATLLPGAEFSTCGPYPDARRLLDAGVTVALATDCNPGTSFTTSMPFVVALAVREMNMTPDEAVWSATAGGAVALRRNDIGVLRVGSRADMIGLDAPSHLHLAYRPGVALVHEVWKDGVLR
ncbi:imidazolonepropionase [Rhodococcus sp. NPDC003318]|uniref:imidazolonepropionase n=1 Tax=Rhodococcus sp. NPDC003318 TaxID=3364503 RepID=UPI0036741525